MAYDASIYEGQRRTQNTKYAQQSAMNALGRFVSQQRGDRQVADYSRSYERGSQDLTRSYTRQTADYTKSYQRQLPKVGGEMGHRGLATGGVQSGLYGRALKNYGTDYQDALARAAEDQATGMGRLGEDRTLGINRSYADTALERNQFDLNQANFDAEHNDALYSIEAERAREIANAAAALVSQRGQFR